MLTRALAFAAAMVELSPAVPEAHLTLGTIHLRQDGACGSWASSTPQPFNGFGRT